MVYDLTQNEIILVYIRRLVGERTDSEIPIKLLLKAWLSIEILRRILGVTTFIRGIKIYWDRFGVVNTLWEIVHLKCTCIGVSYALSIWSHNRVNPSDSHWIED